ncbi:hypothetical protein, partial [Salmonella enterica]|uniref:hypothetical protein n=1 Tax=Salmonella enterica TaxID=28901 RepID=UPI001CF56F59|nr:hypothetical protein [Salmonella enterica subsp. diarizonae]
GKATYTSVGKHVASDSAANAQIQGTVNLIELTKTQKAAVARFDPSELLRTKEQFCGIRAVSSKSGDYRRW